jgi:hypothetical protein
VLQESSIESLSWDSVHDSPKPLKLERVPLPQLIFVESSAESAPADEGCAAVEVWCDAAGIPYARCFARGHEAWTIVPDVCTFRFDPRAERVMALGAGVLPSVVIEETYGRIVLPLVLQFAGREVVHASAVLTRAGVVACCGPTGTGKSTIAFGLSRRGYPLWADDAVVVDMSGLAPVSIPLPYKARLRPTAAAFFARESGCTDSSQRLTSSVSERLAAVCLLKRLDPLGSAWLEVRRLTGAGAVAALLDNALCFSFHNYDRKRLMLEHYMQLAAQVPVLELSFRAGLDVLPHVLDEIEAVLDHEWPSAKSFT